MRARGLPQYFFFNVYIFVWHMDKLKQAETGIMKFPDLS